ncbi:MAG: N-acetylmuramoyl-L-alanine amidase [Cephaloticoccus sp.]|nr:N-acetylmuramoyl-L-alanine amidase [Cephaloticoccus sp.]MCF7759921.1 N-acetylmuramoyl-L-alanine amidase [Cephaloticoccus sp.]
MALVAAIDPAKSVRLAGADYVDAAYFGARYGLKPAMGNAGHKLKLSSVWTTLELEADSRESAINGLRVFLGDPARFYKGALRISRLDAEKLFSPLLLPGENETRVPALKTIVLDAGHGGRDPGKENRKLGVNEKSLTLDTAVRLQKVLESMGYRVILTRSADINLGSDKASDLLARATITKKAEADLFISLHFNAVAHDANRVSGVEVYSLTPRTQYSTADAERDDDRGANERNPGNTNDHWNIQLGYQVHRRMVEELHIPDRGLKRARWAVLRLVDCPAILIESGFLSNDTEARKIATPAYRQKIAEAIANGVQAYGTVLAGVRKQRSGQ